MTDFEKMYDKGGTPMTEFKYKSGDDAIAIVARAIREYFSDDEEKIKAFPSRQMAEIVTSVFLDDAVSETMSLIKHNKSILTNLEGKIRGLQRDFMNKRSEYNRLTERVDNLEKAKEKLKAEIMAYDGKLTGTVEIDAALAGAKKAYDWIFEKTKDAELAAKAFDSYLIGGKYKEGETYEQDIVAVDAKEIIRKATTIRL